MLSELAPIIQILSNIAVIATIILILFQVREASRQTRRLEKTLEFSSYERMIQYHTESRVNFLLPNPELLRWFLQTRGIDSGNEIDNKIKLYILVKIDVHEYMFLQHSEGTLGAEPWGGWENVLKRDFSLNEFRGIWPAVSIEVIQD
jgi:hypothetical protein